MPLAVYLAMESDPDAAIALSLVLLVVSVLVLALLRDRWLRGRGARCDAPAAPSHGRVERGDFALELDAERGAGRGARRPRARTAPASPRCCASLAGLGPLTAGSIRLGDLVLDDAAERRVGTARSERPVGIVFQDYRLFPHLDVRDNVAFAPRSRGAGRAAVPARSAQHWVERLGPRRAGVPPSRPALRRPGPARRAGPGPGRRPRRPAPRRAPGRARRAYPPRRAQHPARSTWRTSPGRSSSSPTTRSRRWSWPTGCSSSRTAAWSRRARRRSSPATRRPTTSPGSSGSTCMRVGSTRIPARCAWTDGGRLVATLAPDGPPAGRRRGARRAPPTAVSLHTSRWTTSARATSGRGRVAGMELLGDRVRVEVGRRARRHRRRHAGRRGRPGPGGRSVVWLAAKATETVAYSRAAVGAEP